jgi:hypothetical protein
VGRLSATALAALAASVVAAAGAGAAPVASERGACTPGLIPFGSVQARVFCGPAKAVVHVGGRTYRFRNGICERASDHVAVDIGTVVIGHTTRPKPAYFGLDVGRILGNSARPAATDGRYPVVALAIDANGKGILVDVTKTTVVLSHGRTKGAITGMTLFPAKPISASFTC